MEAARVVKILKSTPLRAGRVLSHNLHLAQMIHPTVRVLTPSSPAGSEQRYLSRHVLRHNGRVGETGDRHRPQGRRVGVGFRVGFFRVGFLVRLSAG